MNTEVKLKVTEIQRFCMHDGPGVRTVVFLKGCPLRCAWCHNPETQKASSELLYYPSKCIGCRACVQVCPVSAHVFVKEHCIERQNCEACFSCVRNCPTGALEMSGKDMGITEILEILKKDEAFYGENGGVTLSGGEPFAQGLAAVELLKACKKQGLSTAIETCGYADKEILEAALPYVDLFLWDIKDTDEERHLKYTGVSNSLILQNLEIINKRKARIRLRCILVNGINTDPMHYKKISELAESIHCLDGIELLPYHAYGGTKSEFLGMQDSGRKEWIPTTEQMEEARLLLAKHCM